MPPRLLLILPALGMLVFAALVAARDPRSPSPRPAVAPVAPARPEPRPPSIPASEPQPDAIRWRRSVAAGEPAAGALIRGVRLPERGRLFRTWDPVLKRSPNRSWRRWGTDRLVRVVLRAARSYRAEHPGAPPILVGDLSRPRGGDFGPQYGSIGHVTHQNGLDVDVYYARRDRRSRAARRVDQVDLRLAQSLVDHFLRAGAQTVLVGPSTGLTGPSGRVRVVANHDDHLHARIPPG
ncbi:MAG TPA: penicillin-insensitive murein endopeptidase [Thermoleophilaceae bacterium]|nr:penicillin-insensitive murein endopeptidase [Thermoleophilaceae bacterium]